ncbi:MAG: type III-A CRISPR-associated RAMP protein Csm4 [Tannerella sp.]|jgi:CRISPR type III-A-associated RAMP protein Csm4|nr:type III-A CRISPR-associated RAMP protein Csm4 [Tannerella sp.]
MPTYNIIKLRHLTPLHVGSGREYYDFSASNLHSDTLSAALTALRVQQGNATDTETFIKSFTISSAFPFFCNDLFLPKLQGKIKVKIEGKEEKEYRKQLKKLKYIDSSLWNELVSGMDLNVKRCQLKGDFLVKDGSHFEKPSQSQVNQRVSVPRADNSNSDPFFFNWTYFNPQAGLYCLTDAKDSLFEELIALFKLLGETGIGTDRNVGGGKFDVETGEITLPDIEDATHSLLLSLYIPTKEELNRLHLSESRYELLLRGGYIAGSSEERFRHLHKRSVYMFGVGSLFPITESLVGETVNLKPEWNDKQMHSVYRSGNPFYLPVKISES